MLEEIKVNTNDEVKKNVKYFRYSFIILAWIFAICVISQVFIAGLATFVDPVNWKKHTSFIHIFEWLPIIMFILAIFAKLPKAIRWQSLGMYVLIILQYASAHMGSVGVLAAFHTVIALVLFSSSIAIARRASTRL